MSAPVYVASIHDMGPGYLAFDLKEILAALKPFIAQYSWRITGDLDITSNGANREIESLVDRADLSSDELERLSEKIIQTIDGTVVGYPRSASLPENRSSEHDVDNFPNSPAQLVIRAFDSSYFEVYAKDKRIVEELPRHFKDVRIENSELYFV